MVHTNKRHIVYDQGCAAFALVCLLAVALFGACASSKGDDEARGAFQSGNYAAAARSTQKQIKTGVGQVDKKLDAAILLHYAKAWQKSADAFNQTDRDIEAAFTKSISRGVASAAFNENADEYSGNIYEYLLLNAFNCLNYYALGDLDEALVEIRKIENKQKQYVARYGELALAADEDEGGKEADAASKTMNVDLRSVRQSTPRRPTEDDVYKDSAFAHYLATLLYLEDASGTPELHAREYAAINAGFECASLDEDFAIPEGKGRLDFLSLSGKIVERREGVIYFPPFAAGGTPLFITSLRIGDVVIPAFRLKYVWPYVPEDETGTLVRPPDFINRVRVSVCAGAKYSAKAREVARADLKLVEWFDAAVQKDVALKARGEFNKSKWRSTTKKAAAVTAAAALIQATPENFRVLAEIAATKSLDAVDLAETADIRQCRYFPALACGGGFSLGEGVYSARVEYFDARGIQAGAETFDALEVQSGRITLVESVCAR